jgi:hypothetical protein
LLLTSEGVTVTNVGPDELDRRLRDHEARTDRIHAELDNRITQLARDTVPLVVWQQAERTRDLETGRLEREHDEDVKRLRDDVITPLAARVTTLEGRPSMTFGRWVGVLTVVAAFLAVVVAAWSAAKGAK